MYGHSDVVKKLLENNADVNAQNNKYKFTALTLGIFIVYRDSTQKFKLCYLASLNGHIEMVKLLLDHGANIEAKVADGSTALINGITFLF